MTKRDDTPGGWLWLPTVLTEPLRIVKAFPARSRTAVLFPSSPGSEAESEGHV